MASPPSDDSTARPTGPPPHEEAESTDSRATKPPTRRQTMEVQVAWLETRADEPKVEQVTTPLASDVTEVTEFADEEAPTVLRRKPPRVPGSMRTLPPMPLPNTTTKPPPPPRRQTQEVEMAWVELVDDDVVEDTSADELPKLNAPESDADEATEADEITRVEPSPISSQRIEEEKLAARADALEGPPIPDSIREAREKEAQETAKHSPVDESKLAEALKKERLSEFLQAVSVSIPPAAVTTEDTADEAALDKMREEAIAARRRLQDARDREILARRRAERERERLEEEARRARREQEKREEEERAAALRQGTPDKQLLDLSGIDDEIDDALDAVLGPNLSYPPPPPDDDKK